MYSNTAAVLRPDINTVLLEAASTDGLFIGEKVFPTFESDVQTGQFPKFKLGSGELLNNDGSARAIGAAYQRTIRAYETDAFTCVDRGLEELVDDSNARNLSRFFNSEVLAAQFVLRQMRIGHEQRVSTALINADNFTTTAASVAYTEANIATIAFHLDVLAACRRLEAKGCLANTVVLSSAVFDRVRRSTLAQNFMRGAGKATDATLLLGASDLAASLTDMGISQVLVGRLNRNNAKKGQAYSATPIWANTHIWVGKVAAGDFMAGGAGRTIVWNKEGGIFVSETYRDEKLRSNIVRVRQNTAEEVIDTTSGELITTSYS